MPFPNRTLKSLLFAALICFAALWAQQQPSQQGPPPPAQQPAPEDTVIRTTVDVVVAPVTVLDSEGNYVNGLRPEDFHLYDNEKEQDIRVDVAYQPISLVLAIQANDRVDPILPQIRKIGPLIKPLVTGDQGEAAVLAFDHRLQEKQAFTSDGDKIEEAIKKINAGSSSSRLSDAVMQGARMLRSRPPNRRRILLLISETRPKGDEGRIKDSLAFAQAANVVVYSVNISRAITTLTYPGQPPRPDPLPPAARPLPPNVPATPTTVASIRGGPGGQMEFVPLLKEIFKDVKAIFIDNPVEVFTKGTGGAEFPFVRQKALEEAVRKIGEELHSQYLVSYNPNNKDEGGFHEIRVVVHGRRDVKVRTRPGYWLAPK